MERIGGIVQQTLNAGASPKESPDRSRGRRIMSTPYHRGLVHGTQPLFFQFVEFVGQLFVDGPKMVDHEIQDGLYVIVPGRQA